MDKTLDELQIGTVLYDMHNWRGETDSHLSIKDQYHIVDYIRVPFPGMSDMLDKLLKDYSRDLGYVNKHLVIINKYWDGGRTVLTAAWSYDSRMFGMMKIEVHPEVEE